MHSGGRREQNGRGGPLMLLMLLLRLLLMLDLALILNRTLLCIITKLNSVGRRRHCRNALKRRRGSRANHRSRTRATERFEAAAVISTATFHRVPTRIRISKRIIVHTRHEQVQLVVGEFRTTSLAAAAAIQSVVRRVDRQTDTAVSTAVVRHSIQRAANRVDSNLCAVCTHLELTQPVCSRL
jgi:hypothetical protein